MNRLKSRGLKRSCKNEQCALPFYDLNRVAFACPNCGVEFDTTPAPVPERKFRSRAFGGAGFRQPKRTASELSTLDAKSDATAPESTFNDAAGSAPILDTEVEDAAESLDVGAQDDVEDDAEAEDEANA